MQLEQLEQNRMNVIHSRWAIFRWAYIRNNIFVGKWMSIYLGGLKTGGGWGGGGVKVGFYDTCTYRVRTSSEIKKSRVFRAVLLFFPRLSQGY